MLRIYKIMNT